MSPLLKVSLATQRRSVIGWGIGLAAVAAMYAAFYPSITQSAGDLQAYLDKMPDAFRELVGEDYTSPAGYLRAELFSLLGPILFLVFAIGAGAKAIAGEEEARSLDLLLSTPLSRARAQLASMKTLNVLCEFQAVRALADDAAARLKKLGQTESIADVWLQRRASGAKRGVPA